MGLTRGFLSVSIIDISSDGEWILTRSSFSYLKHSAICDNVIWSLEENGTAWKWRPKVMSRSKVLMFVHVDKINKEVVLQKNSLSTEETDEKLEKQT